MKNTFALSFTAMAALLILTIFSLAETPQAEPPVPTEVETYTAGDFDQVRIRKTYRLSPSDDPSTIPTEDFEQSGRTYHLLELTKDTSSRTSYSKKRKETPFGVSFQPFNIINSRGAAGVRRWLVPRNTFPQILSDYLS